MTAPGPSWPGGLGDHDADDYGAVPAVLRPGLEHADGAVAQAVLVELDADRGGGAEGVGQALRLLDLFEDPLGDLDAVAGSLALDAEVAQTDVAGAGGVFDLLGVLDPQRRYCLAAAALGGLGVDL
ncbi:hypothetical protein [Streptomyces salinarius]|uniref:Uncharacterized protein n=1 Tax=Streptomyces salinarius TaxID=2762598 RepID=A0ABW8BLX3_9ACTN